MAENKKYRYNFQDRGKEKVYQSETPYSASTHVLSQYKESKEDSPSAGHKDYSYNKKTGNVTHSHEREEGGVKIKGSKTVPATKEHEEELKNASMSPLMASLLAKAEVVSIKDGKKKGKTKEEPFRVDTKEVDNPKQYRSSTQYSGIDEPSTHSVGFPKVGDNQSIRDKKYKYNPKEQTLEVENRIGNYGRENKKYDTAGDKRNTPDLINASKKVELEKGKFADPKTGKPLEGYALHSKEYSEAGAKKTFPKHVLNASPSKADEYGTKEIDNYMPNKVKDIHSASRAMKQEQYRTKKKGGVYVTEENDPRVFRKETPAETHSSDISSDVSTDKAIARHARKSINDVCDSIMEKTKATKMNRAFQNFARSEDKKIAQEEDKKYKIPRTGVLESGGEVKNVSDRFIRVRPRSSEAMTLSKGEFRPETVIRRDVKDKGSKTIFQTEDLSPRAGITTAVSPDDKTKGTSRVKHYSYNPHHQEVSVGSYKHDTGESKVKKIPASATHEKQLKNASISDQCDDILSKYMGTGRYSGSGENDPVVTKKEGYTVRERPLPGQTKESIKAGHIRTQKEEIGKKLESDEKEKSKVRDEGYKLGQKNPTSQYSAPAPPEKKYSGNWREYFRRSIDNVCDAIMNKATNPETPSWMEDPDSYNSHMSGKKRSSTIKNGSDDSSYNHEYDSHSETPRIKTYDEKQEHRRWRENIAKLGTVKSIEATCDTIMNKGRTFKEIDPEESPRKAKKIKAIERAKDKASYTNRFGSKFSDPPKQAMTLSKSKYNDSDEGSAAADRDLHEAREEDPREVRKEKIEHAKHQEETKNLSLKPNLKKTIDELIGKAVSTASKHNDGVWTGEQVTGKYSGKEIEPASYSPKSGKVYSYSKERQDIGVNSLHAPDKSVKRIPANKEHEQELKNASISQTCDDIMMKCNSHVISSETENGLKKKKKEAPKADGHTLGKNPPAPAADMEMVKVTTEGAFKSKDYEDFQPSKKEQNKLMGELEKESGVKYPTAKEVEKRQATKSLDERTADLHKTQLPGLNKPAVKQTEKVKTTEDAVNTEKPKNLIRSIVDELMQKSLGDIVNRGTNIRRGQAYKNDPDAGIDKKKEKKMDAEEKKAEKSMDDRTAEQYVAKTTHLFKDLVKSEEKPIEFFHTPDETYKSQAAVLNKWKSGNPSSISGNRVVSTLKDMASSGATSLRKEDEDISHEEVKGRKRMDAMDVKAENKRSRAEYSGDEGAED